MIGSFWIRLRRGIERLITGQSLRSRLASLTGISVATAVLLVGSTAYASTQYSLLYQLDQEMLTAANNTAELIRPDIRNLGNLSPGFGTSQELLAVTTATGEISQAGRQTLPLEPEAGDIAVARMQQGHRVRSVRLGDGQEYRLVSVPVRAMDRTGQQQSYAVLYARPLTSLSTTLSSLWRVIALSGLVGILTTTFTALWVAQTALAPVRRLSTAVKNVTQTDQLNPIRIYGRDDLGELTQSFNLMLKTLQTSREQQRQLIADAGHELRTPLTSMRTNIELLVADDKSGMLPEGSRSEILDDVSAQLGEFSALVGDLVALTRDDHLQREPERLDMSEVVEAALARAARRGPNISFHTRLEQVPI
ncbi:MAG: histidine kinase dimerization/phospho-acceptor domain-containing protein, partial [Arachnia propionica]